MPRPSQLIKHDNGRIAVDQKPLNGWIISYNPDTDRFHVHEPSKNLDTVKTFGGKAGFYNARTFARRRSPEHCSELLHLLVE